MPKPNTPKLNDTQLVILSSASQRDETGAETVRTIYRLYQEIRSVDRVNMSRIVLVGGTIDVRFWP